MDYIELDLKNSQDKCLLSKQTYQMILEDEYLKKINLLNELKLHSKGYVVYQKREGSTINTIYLSKVIIDILGLSSKEGKQLKFINKNKLDYRLENIKTY